MDPNKNIFDLHSEIMADYKLYIDSFINIADERILSTVQAEFEAGRLYPDPLIQFNPSFESGGTVEDLINEDVLTRDFRDIYYDENGYSWNIYKHQKDAIKKGNEGKGFIVTSGTGSGKSLTYLSTILNYLFSNPNKKGIKAIIIYPLNALINSQEQALNEFKDNYQKRTGKAFPFTFAKYTGQEKQEDRDKIITNPPEILLTNYMMLELLMVRKNDEALRRSFLDNLKYLVFDELHVYKGRQGADVSLLIRRIKAGASDNGIICIGTSATMATGNIEDQKMQVSKIASRFFDVNFTPESVIVETISYSTPQINISDETLITAINTPISNRDKGTLLQNPLTIWLERNVAIRSEGNDIRRNTPKTLADISRQLSERTNEPIEKCRIKIIEILIWAEEINIQINKQKKRDTILPFKIHQFISQTGYVYLTLEGRDERFITLDPNPFIKLPNEEVEIPVFQTVFSRLTGEEFICVRKDISQSKFTFRDINENQNPRNDDDLKNNDGEKTIKVKSRVLDDYKDGYLLFDNTNYLLNVEDYISLLPSSWLNKANDKISTGKDLLLPKVLYVNRDGSYSEKPGTGEKAWFIPAPLIYDPTAGVMYLEPKLFEKTKLISLGNEGRSTSTTILTLQTLLTLYRHGRPIREQKLLSFTDNRQDASLQSGHFNDFIQVVQLRAAIEKVLKISETPIKFLDLVYKVQETLALQETEYAYIPSPNPNRPDEDNLEALRNYIAYRIIKDLKIGWRFILPNLEQTALLEITYKNIDQDSADESLWSSVPLFSSWSPDTRKDFIVQILNYFRNMYAIDYEMLRYENRQRIEGELNQQLNKEKLWSLDKGEHLEAPNYLSLQGQDKAPREVFIQSVGPYSRLARYIKHEVRKANEGHLSAEDYLGLIQSILNALTEAHYLRKIIVNGEKGEKEAYQLVLSKVLWKRGDGRSLMPDKTSLILLDKDIVSKPHTYFRKIYQEDFSQLPKSYIAAEHTGQINNEQKKEREEKFNEAIELSALYCSPTMELGIDIKSLNIVHMRNVPPSPANYAQRSGRAGRSGQSALVFTYASKVSPHDKNYFAKPTEMVSGNVLPPRIDLTNEELIKSHINASVLSFLNAEEFTPSIVPLIDITEGTYKLRKEIKAKYQDIIDNRFDEIKALVLRVVSSINLSDVPWYNEKWLETQIRNVPDKLENALLRWRRMYLDALRQMNEAHEASISPIIKDNELKKQANVSYARAKDRKELLENQLDRKKNSSLSEFYTFRYLASEGFLPGYNFTRLPIRVFLGGKDRNEAISRSRFIGIKEFGPNNMIYHNGGKYKVNRITPNDVSLDLTKIKISKETNFAFLGDEEIKGKNQDPITGTQFTASNMEIYQDLLELEEAQSENTERISCMEEIRTSEGYETEFFLNSSDGLVDAKKIKLTVDGQELMKLFYAPSAKLIVLNKKWKRSSDQGFAIGTKSGLFKTKKQQAKQSTEDPHQFIKLYTYDTSDVLYIQPIKSLGLTEEGVITLQYALLKAIEQCYNIEPVEIDARLMGSLENKNIMIYEAAEGSLGVLKDIARNSIKLKTIFMKCYEICGYNLSTKEDNFPNRPKASYDDLLSYYNQIHHSNLNRHSIIKALEMLMSTDPDDTVEGSYEDKYVKLCNGLHHKSPGEKELLKYLFENGHRLPEYTNFNLEKYYVQPDFVYEQEKALVFVDGGIHKNAILKADDQKKRLILQNAGFDVLVWDCTCETVESFVLKRQDIFRKVR